MQFIEAIKLGSGIALGALVVSGVTAWFNQLFPAPGDTAIGNLLDAVCPGCGVALSLPGTGAVFKCPACNTTFTAN